MDNEKIARQLTKKEQKKYAQEIEAKVSSVVLNDNDLFAKNMIKVLEKELGEGLLCQNNVINVRANVVEFQLKTFEHIPGVKYFRINRFQLVIGKNTGLKLVYEYLENRQTKNLKELPKE